MKGGTISGSSDEELMVQVQAGDQQAYQTLFERYQAPVWTYLVRRTRDQEAANELFQEAFLKVWRSCDTFKPGQRFKPWVYRIATNAARDRYRYDQREVETADVDVELGSSQPLSHIELMHLEQAIGELPDAYREAFLLGPVQGMDHNEVADVLGISPANARARISRARNKLRERLAELEAA